MSHPPAPDDQDAPEPDAPGAWNDRLAALQTDHPELAGAQIDEVIRHVPGKRAVLRGQMAGRGAVFRFYLDKPEHAARDWNELSRVWPHMNDGDLQVCAPLAHVREAGLLAVADIPGTPLLQLLYAQEPEARGQWLDPAARWLRAYTDLSETETPAAPEGWVKRASRAVSSQPFNRLRRVEKPILQEVHRIGTMLEGTTWRNAISHGDYHPNNLVAEATRLTGIDCGGSGRLPIYKDMARFLMHMGRRGMIPSGEMYLGVDRQGIAAFARWFDLSTRERTIVLPFFIAVEALIRVETRNLPNSRIRRARKMSDALLADLREVGL